MMILLRGVMIERMATWQPLLPPSPAAAGVKTFGTKRPNNITFHSPPLERGFNRVIKFFRPEPVSGPV